MVLLDKNPLYCRFVRANVKVATNMTQADTNKHTLDLSAYIPEDTVAIYVDFIRAGGTGNIKVYPNEGTTDLKDITAGNRAVGMLVGIINQRMQYSLTVANDTMDVWLFGYFVGES